MEKIAEDLEESLTNLRFVGRKVVFKFKLDTFKAYTRDKTVDYEVSTKEQILVIARKLMEKELPFKLRLMGLRVSTLRDLDAVPTKGLDQVGLTYSRTERTGLRSRPLTH